MEIVAKSLVAGIVKRVHVLTLMKPTYGIFFAKDAGVIADEIEKTKMTKAQVPLIW